MFIENRKPLYLIFEFRKVRSPEEGVLGVLEGALKSVWL